MKDPAKQKAAAHEHYLRHKEEMKERAAAWNIRQREILRAYVIEAKNRPCADCRERYPTRVMDFDHVRGKKRLEISIMVNRAYSLEAVKAEIAKCDVVCANCHRIRTWD